MSGWVCGGGVCVCLCVGGMGVVCVCVWAGVVCGHFPTSPLMTVQAPGTLSWPRIQLWMTWAGCARLTCRVRVGIGVRFGVRVTFGVRVDLNLRDVSLPLPALEDPS